MRALARLSLVLGLIAGCSFGLVGCEGGGHVPGGGDGGLSAGDGALAASDAASSLTACASAPLADLGQPCCPTLGPDACGAHLFCAAFDGRTIATCYLEHTRAAGETCSDDRQCVYGSCNLELGRCRAGFEERCTRELGCAPTEAGERQICMTWSGSIEEGTCQRHSGRGSARCYRDEDCLDGTCTMEWHQCGGGGPTDGCDDDLDCNGYPCIEHHCQGGTHGTLCAADEHCLSGRCAGGTCVDGRHGDPCSSSAECTDSFCNLETGRCGERCSTPAACESGLICTRAGRCVVPGSLEAEQPCTDDAQCASGSCYPYGSGIELCALAGGDGTACSSVAPCADSFRCGTTRRCRRDRDVLCGAMSSTESWRSDCIEGTTCLYTADLRRHCVGGDWRVCSSDSDCGAGVSCGTLYVCR